MTKPDFTRLTDTDPVPPHLRGGIVAIGNFDGVHRGHLAVLEPMRAMAEARGVPAMALTFEPHPRTFFRPQTPVFRLTPPPLKAERLAAAGLDGVVEITFDEDFAALSAEDFVDRVLVDRLGVSGAVVGHDFHFGKGRSGSPEVLRALGAKRGFDVTIVAPAGSGDAIWSASAVRKVLAEGRVQDAADILGHRFCVRGEVVHGEKRGRDLGFPTANMKLPPETELRHGVYAVCATVDGTVYQGAANFGRRPQFDNGAPLLETYLLDAHLDLYGKEMEIEFVAFIRPEARFESVEALVERMHVDIAETRDLLARAEAPPQLA